MYDAVVIGLGSMGSSALYHLAKAGFKVAGIEQFGLVHGKGSHSGQTRLIRKAYYESQDYIPLLNGAYRGWKEIERVSGRKLFTKSGIAYFGEKDHPIIKGVQAAATENNIELRACTDQEQAWFDLPSTFEAFTEVDAGYLRADEAIKSYAEAARSLGAVILLNESVQTLEQDGSAITIKTDKGTYQAKKVVITSGAYVSGLIPNAKLPLSVSRQLIGWVKAGASAPKYPDAMPAWIIADKNVPGIYYGFPKLNDEQSPKNGYFKFAHHTVAESIEPQQMDDFDREVEEAKLRSILEQYLPDLATQPIEITTCMYTNTPDEHFIIDFLPDSENNIVLATGFSGHGFKFVPVVGEILADLVTQGESSYDIGFLGVGRF
ncbi:MAG: N-methyl-L-tryptophan oxidase [Balneolaceae bacterium]|nr:N-methyl-L-tryptophan oxidase [Balneolaceae bacterium]